MALKIYWLSPICQTLFSLPHLNLTMSLGGLSLFRLFPEADPDTTSQVQVVYWGGVREMDTGKRRHYQRSVISGCLELNPTENLWKMVYNISLIYYDGDDGVHFVKPEQDVHLRCIRFTLCSYTLRQTFANQKKCQKNYTEI